MDGVLFDSMPLHAKCWVEACRKFGLNATELDTYMNEGRTAYATMNSFMLDQKGREATEEEVERIYQEKCRLFNLCGESRGCQVGLLNSTDSIGSGLQVGIVNSTLEMTGVQIGLVNYTDFMIGFQIGIVNIIRESIVQFFPIVNFCF